MHDFLKWLDQTDSRAVQFAFGACVAAAFFGAFIGTIVLIERGYPLIALGLWLGLPAWFIIAEYRRAKGGKE